MPEVGILWGGMCSALETCQLHQESGSLSDILGELVSMYLGIKVMMKKTMDMYIFCIDGKWTVQYWVLFSLSIIHFFRM